LSILSRLSSAAGRNDEGPNIQLAREVFESQDKEAVKILVEGLSNRNKRIQSDCIKVLYEIGERDPDLIAEHSEKFGRALESGNSRLVWGAMTALDSIASTTPARVSSLLEQIMVKAEGESVIARDHAVGILTKLAILPDYSRKSIPLLLDQLKRSPANQFPMYAEMALPVFVHTRSGVFVNILEDRLKSLEKESQRKRIRGVLKRLQS
jgi:hypothetical protein